MLKYPLGIQTFEKIREDGLFYVDKTDLVYRLVKTGRVYSLSRSRRFGKSLLVSTLKSYYEGRKELFEGLAMAELKTEWLEYPVSHVDFNGVDFLASGQLEGKLEQYVSGWELDLARTRQRPFSETVSPTSCGRRTSDMAVVAWCWWTSTTSRCWMCSIPVAKPL